jgi:hypothetical protein
LSEFVTNSYNAILSRNSICHRERKKKRGYPAVSSLWILVIEQSRMQRMAGQIGRNQFDVLVEKFTKQGMTAAQARQRARIATRPKLTPPPGVKQQPRRA